MSKIFISHAHKDEPLVTKFVEVILDLGCGVPRDEIFCTSYPDKGVTEGANFINEIEKNLRDANFVILMISPNYYESQFCLGELGATWALQSNVFPIVINLALDKVKALLQVTHIGMIEDKSHLNKLHDRVVKTLAIDAKTDTWDRQCTAFLNALPALLKSLPKPTIILYSDHEKLQQELTEANKQLNERAIEIERLLEKIARLEEAKDKDAVEKIKAEFSVASKEEQVFNVLLKASVDALRVLPETVDNVVYEYFRDRGLVVDHHISLRRAHPRIYENIKYAEDYGFIKWDNSGYYIPNKSNKKIENAITALNKLFNYMREIADTGFAEELEDELDYAITDAPENRGFWEKYIQATFSEIPS